MKDRDNAEWIRELRSRDGRALADLRAALVGALRKTMSGRGLAAAAIDDAAQEAIVRVLEKLDQFEGRSRLVTWATAIAIRIALAHARREQWGRVSLDALVDATPAVAAPHSPPPGPEASLRRAELLDALRAAIEQSLTERQRRALTAELRGMPMEQIAAQLGSNRNAVYKLTHDARRRLRATLEAAGFAPDDLQSLTAR